MIPSESNGDSNAIIPSNGDTEGFSVEQVHIIQINSYYQSGGGREEERRSVAWSYDALYTTRLSKDYYLPMLMGMK